MSGNGGYTLARGHSDDRFYNPPAIRRQLMLLKQQQQQLPQRLNKLEADVTAAGNRTDSDGSSTTLSKPASVSSSSPPTINVTNLDRLLESVTPFVPAHYLNEARRRRQRTREAESHPYYCLGDLWESFSEWSVYGLGVPLLLNGEDSIIQYYVPFLSGIQLYIDPLKPSSSLRRPGEESNAESSRGMSAGESSDCEMEGRSKSSLWGQHGLVNSNTQQLNRISSNDEAESCNSPGQLLFEYLEHEQPYHRRPLTDKIAILASQFPELKNYRSCDLLPASWISVAWYPIYRIPMGTTLRDLDASFLTFHSLATKSEASSTVQHSVTGRRIPGNVDAYSRISLPVFGLASYKLKGSILSPCGPHESEQENSLLQTADSFLQRLQIVLPDYQFFRLHYSRWK